MFNRAGTDKERRNRGKKIRRKENQTGTEKVGEKVGEED